MSNLVILHGHVGKVPEEKVTTSGAKFARFSFATTETWKDSTSGEKKTKTEWHQIVAWGAMADRVIKGIDKKGKELNIFGKIEYTQKDDPNNAGKKLNFTNIKLTSFEYCGKRDENSSYSAPDPDPGRDANYSDDVPVLSTDSDDGEIAF